MSHTRRGLFAAFGLAAIATPAAAQQLNDVVNQLLQGQGLRGNDDGRRREQDDRERYERERERCLGGKLCLTCWLSVFTRRDMTWLRPKRRCFAGALGP